MKTYKEVKPLQGTSMQNKRGEWVPAIPEPYYAFFVHTCDCGKGFWSRERYEEHYAYKHILGL